MGKGRHIFDQIMDQAVLNTEILPGQTIVEIVGERRVLIENHLGVAAYGKDKVLVNVKFGLLCICGCNLEITQMTKEQLVIYGRIRSVDLQRRN